MGRFDWVIILLAARGFFAAESVYSQPPGNRPASKADSSASATQHLSQVFAEVSREDRGLRKGFSRYFSSWYNIRQHLESWSLDAFHGPSLRRSIPLHALVVELRQDETGPGAGQRRIQAYVEAAAVWLADPDPKRRAFAVELLAMLPVPTLESGLIAKIAPLMADDAKAWDGFGVGNPQWAQAFHVTPVEVRVSDVARSALATLTPYRFPDAATFARWWQANRDVRAHTWYWNIRWRRIAPETVLDELGLLEPDQGLRMLLLASNRDVLVAEARQSAGPELDLNHSMYGHGSSLGTALFVRKHKLNDTLFNVLEGNIAWPEAKEGSAAHDVTHKALHALEETLTPQDLPRLRKLMREPKGLFANDPNLHLALTRIAIRWLPDEHESILVSHLRKDPGRHALAVELLEDTGLKHWQLIKESYATRPAGGDSRYSLIRAVPLAADEKGRQCLGELLAMDELEVVEDGRDAGQESRFRAFVEAANMAARREIISQGELDAAIYRGGKGGDRREAEIIAQVPEKRRQVLEKLRQFVKGAM